MPDAAERAAGVDWQALRARFRGEVILAGDDAMVLAGKQLAAGRPLQTPQALLRCADLDDVHRALEHLRRHDVPFALRSGGHCFADLSSSAGAVIDLGLLDAIALDDRGTVTVGPGTSAARLAQTLAASGRAVPTGGCPWVAMGGLSLVGGFGFLGRRHGLTVDHVQAVHLIDASGDARHVGVDADPALFWALRGAGAAGFGIAAELTLRTHPLPAMTVCHGQWPLCEAVALIRDWQHWAPAADPALNLELGLTAPDDPDEPCQIELFGVVLGDVAAVAPHLAALRRRLGPLAAPLGAWPAEGVAAAQYLVGLRDRRLAEAWQPSRPYREHGYQFTRSDFFDAALDDGGIADCVAQLQTDRRYAQFRELELVPWGGAYAQSNPHACFAHRTPRMLVRHTAAVGARATPALQAHARAWVDASQATLHRHASGRVYQGYADPRLDAWGPAHYGGALPRLQQVKRRVDPDDVFRHAQSIAPAEVASR